MWTLHVRAFVVKLDCFWALDQSSSSTLGREVQLVLPSLFFHVSRDWSKLKNTEFTLKWVRMLTGNSNFVELSLYVGFKHPSVIICLFMRSGLWGNRSESPSSFWRVPGGSQFKWHTESLQLFWDFKHLFNIHDFLPRPCDHCWPCQRKWLKMALNSTHPAPKWNEYHHFLH